MKNWIKKENVGASLLEREQELFSDFKNARANSSSYKIKNTDTVISYIKDAINHNYPIRIVGDYDVDGVCSTSELKFLLIALGAKESNLDYYLPKRFTDGYGISMKIVDNFLFPVEKDKGLLITVDNGIVAKDAIKKAKSLGWKVIIIDHHQPEVVDDKVSLPAADLIIDPHAIKGSSNFEDYCAGGLVYKIAQTANLSTETLNLIKSFAMMATVCDVVKLIEEIGGHYVYDNYIIVKEGLQSILQNSGRTTGLYCLLRALGLDYSVSESEIGFIVGPVINAAARLNDTGAQYVFEFLTKNDNNFSEADEIANILIENNKTRKKMTSDIMPILTERIASNNQQNDYPLLVLGKPDEIGEGLIGLIAGKISEEYSTICAVLTPVGDGLLKGSCRGPEGSRIKNLLDSCKDYLVEYGGHDAAGGFSLKEENFEKFKQCITAAAGKKPETVTNAYYDYTISTDEVADNLNLLDKYAPFGAGHTIPIYKIENFTAQLRRGVYYSVLGKGSVFKIHSKKADLINFTGEGEAMYKAIGKPINMDVIGTLRYNVWNGNKYFQIAFKELLKRP
mgnify:FL=1